METESTVTSQKHVVVFGGSGFVGLAVCKALVEQGCRVTAVSRSGKPLHLAQQTGWSQQVCWQRGDALIPEAALFTDADSVVTLIGSPPLPTTSESAYRQKVFTNSEPNRRVIEAASTHGVKHIVLMAADVPKSLQTKRFAYWEGKRLSIEAAEAFANQSAQHAATVCYPSGIYGTRYLSSGFGIPLHWFMAPIAWLQQKIPDGMARKLPAILVADHQVAKAVANACVAPRSGVQRINNTDISAL